MGCLACDVSYVILTKVGKEKYVSGMERQIIKRRAGF